jgi:hypothetical protein
MQIDGSKSQPLRSYLINIFPLSSCCVPHNHFRALATLILNRCYLNIWIGRGGRHAWPPLSPHLTLLAFYFWGYVKELIFQEKSQIRDELSRCMMDGAALGRDSDLVTVTFDTIVAFVIPLDALRTSSSVMWHKGHLWNFSVLQQYIFPVLFVMCLSHHIEFRAFVVLLSWVILRFISDPTNLWRYY